MRLSSHLTFFYKLVFPGIWVGLWGGSVVSMLRAHGGVSSSSVVFLGVLLAVIVFFVRMGLFSLKRVTLGPDGVLRIDNFLAEAAIPLDDVDSIEETGSNMRPIWIHLRRPCRFGSKIVFMPYLNLDPFSPHPAAAALRGALAARVR